MPRAPASRPGALSAPCSTFFCSGSFAIQQHGPRPSLLFGVRGAAPSPWGLPGLLRAQGEDFGVKLHWGALGGTKRGSRPGAGGGAQLGKKTLPGSQAPRGELQEGACTHPWVPETPQHPWGWVRGMPTSIPSGVGCFGGGVGAGCAPRITTGISQVVELQISFPPKGRS